MILAALPVTSASTDITALIDTAAVDTAAPEATYPITDTAAKASAAGSSSDADSVAAEDSPMTPYRPTPPASPAVADSMLKSTLSEKTAGTLIRQSRVPSDTSVIDTSLVRNGSYLSAGFGWSLGGFTLLSLWENALPDSLGSFELSDTSFGIPYDSAADPQQPPADTARLSFSVKENPAAYTMCFPVSLSLIRLRENDRFAFSLYGSWMRKIFAATVAAVGDSLVRKVDYRERVNVFSAFLSFAYGRQIPREYFSIQDAERSYFNAAVECAPLIACIIRRSVNAPVSDVRFEQLQEKTAYPPRRFLHGRAVTLRLGLNMVKRVNAVSATDFGIAYCVQGYGYFYENGNRVTFAGVDPSDGKKGRPLFWISHRFAISIAILRLYEK